MYTANATRINVSGKPDYLWQAKYSNGLPMLFKTRQDAFDYASGVVADSAHHMRAPVALWA